MFSAKTEKGPVTPRIVRGWIENLHMVVSHSLCGFESVKITYREKIVPHNPVLKTTSIVPQLLPVRTYRSLANVIPGRRFVKKT
jgi:hypothetical protein